MKAELDADGCLVIKAESPVESFALGHWFELWRRHEALMRVETPKEVPFVRAATPTTTVSAGQEGRP